MPFSSSFAFLPLEKRLKNETKASLALFKAPNIPPKPFLKAVIVGSSPAFKPVKNPLKKAFNSSQYLYTKSPATAIAIKIAPIGLVANAKLTAFNTELKAIIPTLALDNTAGSFKSKPLKELIPIVATEPATLKERKLIFSATIPATAKPITLVRVGNFIAKSAILEVIFFT